MERYIGKSVMRGIAIGRVYLYKKVEIQVTDEKVPDAEAEKERFMAAVDRAKAQLTRLYDDALQNVGEDHAAIFDVHRMLLEDEDYLETAAGEIEKGYNAVYAVDQAGTQFAELFAAMDDEYMRGRAADIRDISQRVIRILLDLPEEEINPSDDTAEPAGDAKRDGEA